MIVWEAPDPTSHPSHDGAEAVAVTVTVSPWGTADAGMYPLPDRTREIEWPAADAVTLLRVAPAPPTFKVNR